MTKLEEVELIALKDKKWTVKDFMDFLVLKDRAHDLHEFTLERIVMEKAAETGLKATDSELQKHADTVRLEMGLFKAAEFQAFLDDSDLTLEDYEKKVEVSIVREKLKKKVVADKDVEKAFYESKLDYDRATLSRIIVKDAGLAKEIVNAIKEKESTFEEMAKKHTIIAQERFSGGFQGTFRRKSVHPSMQAAVFNAKAGSVVGPVKVGSHHHIDWVHELKPAELTDELKAEIREELFKAWLTEALEKSGLQVLA